MLSNKYPLKYIVMYVNIPPLKLMFL